MLNRLIRFSLAHRAFIVVAALVVLVLGFQIGRDLPVDVLPDLTKPTVTLLTEAPGLAPEEVEAWVTLPLEGTLMGTPGLTRLRSISDVSLSLVYVEFDWGTDIYRARQLVQERLQSVEDALPEGVTPYLTPVASLMGEIMLVGMRSTDGKVSARDLRTMADWTVRRRLQGIPGVAEVLAMGGGVKQVQVQPDPQRMQALKVSFAELWAAAAQAASSSTGGFLSGAAQEIMVRNLAMTTELKAIGSAVIKHVDDRPITIDDVAEVVWDVEPMRGDAAVNGTPGVILSVTKAPGFDTLSLTAAVEQVLADLRPSLPEGVELVSLFRQADFIEHATSNLKEAIRDGGVMVAIVLFLFLLNVRTTVITLTAIPLSFAMTLMTFKFLGIGVNSMTLGGLAVAIGMVVDDAIVDVENVFRRLRENAASGNPRSRLAVIAGASAEVRNSILYATLFIILVFLPLLGLQGVPGRLFTPIAIATILSMAASFLVSLTVIPVLCSLILRPKAGDVLRDGWLVRVMKSGLQRTWLCLALDAPFVVLLVAGVLLAIAVALYPRMGKEFLPVFREEMLLVALTAAPGTSLRQTSELAGIADKLLLSVPEVHKVGRRLGRAERGDHVVPVSTVEFDVEIKSGERPRAEVMAEIREKLSKIPGTFSALSGPLADRIGHMLSGVSAKVAVKIYGPELGEIRRIGAAIQGIAQEIPGLEAARIEQQALIPQLRIEMDRERALAYGVTAGALNQQLSALMGGDVVGQLYEGQRRIDLVVRLPESWRESPERLSEMYIDTVDAHRIPLGLVAMIREATGPNVIMRENMERRFVVSVNPTKQDLVSLVARLQDEVAAKVSIPEGYHVSFEGEYRAQQAASRRIAILSGLVILVMTFLLRSYFGAGFFAAQVLFDVPLALVGGLALTWMVVNNISIASLVGMIAVAGIAARNSVMMLSHYLHLMRHEGERFSRAMIERGTLERLVPVLMTALSAGIALLPLVLAAEAPGKEILHPVAVVIVGGLLTSTFLGLGVTPAVFYLFGRRAAERAVAEATPATV
ncbi:MAG: Cobalt-zinc-cadmium resistance protein CzcA [Verrucomicrobia subdivision 3 bacterium]|nr:Cobalt-zinc-cadmium resistance protein CzcA [Limisphaerales bacterium]MCS1412627.1 Cobalt-zinc-cadmium resistance protein CzcA [Limisphaerales bacterium]